MPFSISHMAAQVGDHWCAGQALLYTLSMVKRFSEMYGPVERFSIAAGETEVLAQFDWSHE